MSAIQPTPFYRSYELPWTGDPESGRRFRRWFAVLLLLLVVFGSVIPLLPLPKASQAETSVPERLARVMIQNKPKPPPPPPPKAQEKPKPPEHTRPIIKPPEPKDLAREKAQKQLNKIKDDLADLRQKMDLSAMMQNNLSGTVLADARAERNLISSKVGTSSGGIGSSPVSRNFGGGSGTLGQHDTGAVNTTMTRSALDGRPASRTGGASGKAARSREEIETVFDRNKGALYSLYNRALRENAALQGKLVLEFTISPSGQVTMCRVISTELNDKNLEEKIIALVRLFHFQPRTDVEAITTTKPIDFFPA
jgi:TonB family protein